MEEYLWLARKWKSNKAMTRIIFLNAVGRRNARC